MAFGLKASKEKSSQQQSQSSGPWRGWQPYGRGFYESSQGLLNQGTPEYYGGNTVAGINPFQDLAIASQFSRGIGGSAQEGALGDYIGGALGGTGAGVQNLSNLAGNPFRGQGGAQLGGAAQGLNQVAGASERGIGDFDPGGTVGATAQGQFVGQNPFLNQAFNQAAGQVTDQFRNAVQPGINQSFGGAGRTGSFAHAAAQGQAAKGLGNSLQGLASNIYGGGYEAERGRQQQAALSGLGQGIGLYGQQQQNRLGAGGAVLGAQTQLGLGNQQAQLGRQGLRLDAANSLVGAQQGAAGLVPGLSGLQWNNLGQAGQVGDRLQGQQQRGIDANVQRHDYYRDAPYNLQNQAHNWFFGGGIPTVSQGQSSQPKSAAQAAASA